MSDLGDKFFASLLTTGDSKLYLKLGNVGAVFDHVKSDQEDYQFIQKFFHEYGKLPKLSTFNQETGKELKPNKEDTEYFFKKLTERHVKKSMIKAAQVANEKLQKGLVQEAFDIMKNHIEEVTMQSVSSKLFDFRESHDMIKSELLQKKKDNFGIMLGWKSVDEKTGGIRGGDLLSVCGRIGLGKTMMLVYSAHHAWQKHKKKVLFVSMEMPPVQIFERLAASNQKIPFDWIKYSEFPTLRGDRKKEFLKKLKKLNDPSLPMFVVVDGNFTTAVQEITALAKQLKPDVVFVDGAYLVRSEEGFSKHEKVGIVCNTLKRDISDRLGIPVVASWQFSRESTKVKKGQKVGTEHIGDSDEIGRASSVILGLFQEETAATIKQREVRFVKGRSGETGEFQIYWDFHGMNFDEIEEIRDHQVLIT